MEINPIYVTVYDPPREETRAVAGPLPKRNDEILSDEVEDIEKEHVERFTIDEELEDMLENKLSD